MGPIISSSSPLFLHYLTLIAFEAYPTPTFEGKSTKMVKFLSFIIRMGIFFNLLKWVNRTK